MGKALQPASSVGSLFLKGLGIVFLFEGGWGLRSLRGLAFRVIETS